MAEDFDAIRSAMEKVPAYSGIFNKVRDAKNMKGGQGVMGRRPRFGAQLRGPLGSVGEVWSGGRRGMSVHVEETAAADGRGGSGSAAWSLA
jgi:hypothetical protein